MTEDEEQDVAARLADGIAEAVGPLGDVPTRWIAVVETMDTDGQRCMYRISTPGMTPWDVVALHEFAMTKERAQMMREELFD